MTNASYFVLNQIKGVEGLIQEERMAKKILRVIEEQSLAQWDLTNSLSTEIVCEFSVESLNKKQE